MTRPKRILHLRASNFVGGPEQQLLRMAEAAQNGEWELILGTFTGATEDHAFLAAIKQRNLPAIAVPARLIGGRAAVPALVRTLREHKIDLICTHGYKADLLGGVAARVTRIPAAWFLRGWTGEDWKVSFYEALDRGLLPVAGRIVCLSETQAARLSRRVSLAGKIRVIPNSIDVPEISAMQRRQIRKELRSSFDFPLDAAVVATAGRLSPEKGTDFFLRAIPEIRKHYSKTCFLVFGEGVLKSALVDAAQKLGLGSETRFAGFAGNLRQLLPGIDILVNPSLAEEMPNVVLEAMAAEVPVIATAVGGVEEIAGSERSLEVVPAADASAIARAVVSLLAAPEDARRLGRRGQQRVQQAYSVSGQRVRLEMLYAELAPPSMAEARRKSAMGATSKLRNTGEVPPSDSDDVPFISVVIPVRNEEAHVAGVLQQLLVQRYRRDRFEILAVDGGSSDRTREIVESVIRDNPDMVRLLDNPVGRSSAGRNVGVQNSRGELIIFVDGHCRIPGTNLLADTARLFQSTAADCLCRPQPLQATEGRAFQESVAWVRSSPLGHARDSTIYSRSQEGPVEPMSSGASYRRSVFDRVGWYDERFDACEDVEFNYRVWRQGLRSYISPCLAVNYQARDMFSGLWKQMMRYGRGRYRFLRKHPDAMSLAQLLPSAFLVWLGLNAAGAWLSPAFAATLVLTLALYLGVVLVASLLLAVRHGWRTFFIAPAVYVAVHLGLGAGFVAECWGSIRQPLSRRN